MPRKADTTIIDKVYNNLKADKLTDQYNSYHRRLYECTCLLCGKKRLATKQNLQRNEVKDCGNHRDYKDIKNKRFGKLVAVYVTDQKSHTKSRCKIWHCKCDCGNECDVHYDDLKNGKVKSCGCLKNENIQKLYAYGTAPCKLNGNKIRKTNTSGTTGVWFDKSRNRWCAEIMFKKTKYFLGRYKSKEEAINIRKIAEDKIFCEFLEWYEKTKKVIDFLRGIDIFILYSKKRGSERKMPAGHLKNEHDKENKEQDFETTFLHGHDGSQCIYYTNEKCLYYNDCESPCHHCHHYTTKIRN